MQGTHYRAAGLAALVVIGVLSFSGVASAAEVWEDSEPQFSLIETCLTGEVDGGLGVYVGVLRDRAALPTTGSVFYGRTVASVVGKNCNGHAVRLEVSPPPGTSVAISPSAPVRCFTRHIPTGVTEAMPASRCPQRTSAAIYGGAVAFDPADGGGAATWDIPDQTAIEIQFPLVATNPLAGLAVTPCDCLRIFTKVIATWDNPILTSSIEVVVGAAPVAPAPGPVVAAPPPPPPPPPADTIAPAAELKGSTTQKLAKTVAVSVSCAGEPCRVKAGGSIRVPKRGAVSAKTYKLQAVSRQLAQGEKVIFKPRLTASARSAIRRALKAGKKIVVKLEVQVSDGAGNRRTLTRQVRLKL